MWYLSINLFNTFWCTGRRRLLQMFHGHYEISFWYLRFHELISNFKKARQKIFIRYLAKHFEKSPFYKFSISWGYTGWQRYFRNTFKASLSHLKKYLFTILLPQNHLSCLPKHKQKEKDTFQQRCINKKLQEPW